MGSEQIWIWDTSLGTTGLEISFLLIRRGLGIVLVSTQSIVCDFADFRNVIKPPPLDLWVFGLGVSTSYFM